MGQLIVRNLPEAIVRALKVRAAAHGRSAEEEHRRILEAALMPHPTKSFKAHLLDLPDVGDDVDFERPRDYGRDIDL